MLAAAFILAFGADHLELGEHLPGLEYFPNENLRCRVTLRSLTFSLPALAHWNMVVVDYP